MKAGQKLTPAGRVTRKEVEQIGERFEHRGRGAISNPSGRFETDKRVAFDDGWDTIEDAPEPIETTLT